jgi:hypothetical protein
MIMLDDENREALQCLLLFLHDISVNSATNKVSFNDFLEIFFLISLINQKLA